MRVCPRCQASYAEDERFCPRDRAALVEEADLRRIGTVVGNYRLLEVLGRGGMGTVYRGEHVYIERPVAVKLLHERFTRYEEAVRRFLSEARAASLIAHPNIVDVTDFGPVPDGAMYYTMEYIEGESLEDLIDREAPLPLHRAINIVNQIASALAAAHDKRIVHRDLKPENVMLTRRPGRREVIRLLDSDVTGSPRFVIEKEDAYDFVKVLDFGIAKVLQPEVEGSGRTTLSGTIFGTPEYMSPEAARGESVDHRADVYSLGCLFYDMLTGEVPFKAASPIEILNMHMHHTPRPPSQVAPQAEITTAAERLILKALAKDPARRQQSMEKLREELQGCYGSVAYRRDAHRIPGADASGMPPRPRRLTDELDDRVREHHDELRGARRRLEATADAPRELDREATLPHAALVVDEPFDERLESAGAAPDAAEPPARDAGST